MRCAKVTQQLSAFLDGELKPSEAEQVREHLESCPNCRKERQALEATIRSVRDLPAMRAPSDLASRVLADIEKADAKPAQRAEVIRARFSMRMLWPAAAALLLGVGIAVLSRSTHQTGTKDFATARSERRVAMFDESSEPRTENTYIGEETDNSYAFWDESGRAPQSEEDRDAPRAMPSLAAPDKKMPELAFAPKDKPVGAAGRGGTEGVVFDDNLGAERLEKDGADAALAMRLRGAAPGEEKEHKVSASLADAIAAPRTREFEIRSEDPHAAYAKVAAISARFTRQGKPVTDGYVYREFKREREGAAPQKLVLTVTSSQLDRIKKEIAGAGLVAVAPEKAPRTFAAAPGAPARRAKGARGAIAGTEKLLTAKEEVRKTAAKTPAEVAERPAPVREEADAVESRRIAAPQMPSVVTDDVQTEKLPAEEKIISPKRSVIEPPRSVNGKADEAEQKQTPPQPTPEKVALEAPDTKTAIAARRIDKTPEGALDRSAVTGAGGAEPLIRVSISFIKIDEKAAAAVEMPAADADIKVDSE